MYLLIVIGAIQIKYKYCHVPECKIECIQSIRYLQMSKRLESNSLLKFQCSCMGVSNEVKKNSVSLTVQQSNQLSDFPAAEPWEKVHR